ncbi:unnamed protein product [Calicophoron daubneyi]|uniref:ADF-H domain-containing protein n=1 Tax=Calicophoron daubneyi TaxID=300641 RepID=A0AAV2TBW3_CALDB
MSNPQVAVITEESLGSLRDFKFHKTKTNDALILKIDAKTMSIEKENLLVDTSLDTLSDELPSYEPRYVLLSYCYQKADGRIVYPYCMIFSTPEGCPPTLKMLYTASLSKVMERSEVGKVYELRDIEDLTDEWLKKKLEK